MWGNIAIESITQVNFGTGFSNTKSDTLIHLAQWQYWWWFWFSFLWSFYYLLVLRVVRFRSLKFRPRIATTTRPHGKWGDLLVCIIPVSWCSNIISNSNLVLRMIEWQAESGLFTVRIRGKQWYWLYKFELKTLTDILTAPKNWGRNKWRIMTPGDLQGSDDYLHLLQLRSQNKWVKKFWQNELTKNSRTNNFHIDSPYQVLAYNFFNHYDTALQTAYRQDSSYFIDATFLGADTTYNTIFSNTWSDSIQKNKFKPFTGSSFIDFTVRTQNKPSSWLNLNLAGELDTYKPIIGDNIKLSLDSNYINLDRRSQINSNNYITNILKKNISSEDSYTYSYKDHQEDSRWRRRSYGSTKPLRIIKLPITSKVDFDMSNVELFRFRWNDSDTFDSSNTTIKAKPMPHATYLIFKQKRYSRRKVIEPRLKLAINPDDEDSKIIKHSSRPLLVDNKIIVEGNFPLIQQYTYLKKKKARNENTSIVLSPRLLRTKRTLVLPAHVNITAITNSYDVIHSWFIPGLGLKMDCIPGRSTHHTFYIDNVGFYYGQCAEVCGRFHHHMPIRVCALPYEHFLLWWHSFGLPKLLNTAKKKDYRNYYGLRKFVW